MKRLMPFPPETFVIFTGVLYVLLWMLHGLHGRLPVLHVLACIVFSLWALLCLVSITADAREDGIRLTLARIGLLLGVMLPAVVWLFR